MPHNWVYQKAVKEIEIARQKKFKSLHLDNYGLDELPESLGELTWLESLSLSHNSFETLPDFIKQLKRLQYLNLSLNRLKTLPECLANLTHLQSLHLEDNQLTILPELGQYTQLQFLNLAHNRLTKLPKSIGQLSQLQELELSHNRLTPLPQVLGQLTQLQSLNIDDNQLSKLPLALGRLKQLRTLCFSNNELTLLPEWLRHFSNIKTLAFSCNQIMFLPDWIGQLENLREIYGTANEIENIPETLCNLKKLKILALGGSIVDPKIGIMGGLLGNNISSIPNCLSKLPTLDELYLDNNPLNPALQSAYKQGLPAVKAYLRSLEQNAEPLYEAKLVLVGEGNVGKTTLLKALKGKAGAAPQEHEPTTHGVEIDIHGLRLPHPAHDGVKIQLNAWDFGGQDVYRVTHQFFFSRRSLYLLVWEPRRGVQQGQVEDWLNMIRLRVGDDARVIIVSTHCKTGERIARIDQPVFKQQYGDMIVGFHEVDSLVPDPNSNKWGWASTATGKPPATNCSPAPNRASLSGLLAESAPHAA
jgi:Leucine-rich repeat (LRR) protein